MQERRKREREGKRDTGRWGAVCGRKEGSLGGIQYCVSNKGVLKGERIVACFLCSLSVAFFLPSCRYSFEFHLSQDGKDGIFVNRHV